MDEVGQLHGAILESLGQSVGQPEGRFKLVMQRQGGRSLGDHGGGRSGRPESRDGTVFRLRGWKITRWVGRPAKVGAADHVGRHAGGHGKAEFTAFLTKVLQVRDAKSLCPVAQDMG